MLHKRSLKLMGRQSLINALHFATFMQLGISLIES